MTDATALARDRLGAASQLYDVGNYAGARRLLAEALAADPELREAHTTMALVHYQQNDARAALAAADASLALEPTADAFRVRALALDDLKRGKAAVEAAREAVALAPHAASAAEVLAVTLEGAGKWKEAEAGYRRAVELSPGHSGLRAAFGRFYIRRKKFAAAEAVAAEIEPAADAIPVLLLRGELALWRKRYAEARDLALWVLSRSANHREAIRILTLTKAARSPALGAWWRWVRFTETAPLWQRIIAIFLLLVFSVITGGMLWLLWGYAWLANRNVAKQIAAELKTVELSKSF